MRIEVEGCDGTGKSTLVQGLLEKYPGTFRFIPKHNIDTHPDMVNDKYVDINNEDVKFFLYLTEHTHLNNIYLKYLDDVILSDRGIFSFCAYNNYFTKGKYCDIIRTFLEKIKLPDVVFYLKMDLSLIESRIKGRENILSKYELSSSIKQWQGIDDEYEKWFDFAILNTREDIQIIYVDASLSIICVRQYVERYLEQFGVI